MGASGRHDEKKGGMTGIREVKARHEEHLLSMPGVVSVGIGMSPEGKPEIVVGMDRERPETAMQIPGELEGFRTRVEIAGAIRALKPPSHRNIKP
jgi:hypothetical protein